MQKKIIALAVAGLMSGAAFAQSNVTVFGVVDLSYVNATSDGATAAATTKMNGVQSGILSGSRLGFKGKEDLGGGLSALFHLEFGSLNADVGAGNGINNTRQSYVGLSSKSWGTVALGRQYTPGHVFAVQFDAEAGSGLSALRNMAEGNGANLTIEGGGDLGRQDNAIAYVSPNLGGFTVTAAYGSGEQEAAAGMGGTEDQSVFGLSAVYSQGPMAAGIVYHKVGDVGGTAVGGVNDDLTEWALGASYDFGMVKLFGTYQDFEADDATAVGVAAAGAKYEGDIWSLGVVVPVSSAGSIRLSFADMDRTSTTGAGVRTDLDASSWALSYQHALSKRTTAYVGYTSVDNKNNSAVRINLGVAAPSAGLDSDGFAMGLRHSF